MNQRITPMTLGIVVALVTLVSSGFTDEASVADRIDFDQVLRSVGFDAASLDGNLDATTAPNGIPDGVEMALIAAVLNDPDLDLSNEGGIKHGIAMAAYQQCLASALKDTQSLQDRYPQADELVAGYAMVGTQGSFESIAAMLASFGSPLKGDYTLARGMEAYFAPDGDADGDGKSNRAEYSAYASHGEAAYVSAALDPQTTPTEDAPPLPTTATAESTVVGVVLYPGFEVLDVYGPVEMWGYVPGFKIVTVAEKSGPVQSTQGLATIADYSFEDCPELNILFVPGGVGTLQELQNKTMIEFLKKQHASSDLTASVCSGSALLAKSGILDGLKATSNKAYFSVATDQSDAVEWIKKARWVEDGKVITSSGVSAGIDMALHIIRRLHGADLAEQIAHSTEYVWNSDSANDPFAIDTD